MSQAETPPSPTAAHAASEEESTTTTADSPEEPHVYVIHIPISLLAALFGQDGMSFEQNLEEVLRRSFAEHQPKGVPPAAESTLESLPTVKISEELSKDCPSCSICLMDWEDDEEVAKLPCTHLFHRPCVETWLKEHSVCPVCRYELPTANAEYEKDRKERMQLREKELMERKAEEELAAKRSALRKRCKCEMAPILMEDCVLLQNKKRVRLNPCKHEFHQECLSMATRVKGAKPSQFQCPSCRKWIQQEDVETISDPSPLTLGC